MKLTTVTSRILLSEIHRVLYSILFLSFFTPSYSQEKLTVARISGEIIFDGKTDDSGWLAVKPLPFKMYMPVYNNDPSEKSEVRIAYDETSFYVSGNFHYSNPDDMRPIGKKRDYDQPTTDWFTVILDSFNDKETGLGFSTNPNGLRADFTIKNDALNMQEDVNFSWNTFWDVKTDIRDSSWSTEIRIPLSSLRFQPKDGITDMGLIIYRYYPAKAEMITFPAVEPKFSYAFWKPSLSQTIEFEGLKPRKPLYIAPYATAGFTTEKELNTEGTGYTTSNTPKLDAGLDLKYSITNNLTMDITLNTDFAQVEADDQRINLSRYSLFFPEKRVFFQEKSDVFDFSFPGMITSFYSVSSNLFYSRRIGLYDNNPVRIFGGFRMTGRVEKWDIGILDLQTASIEGNPSENFGVVRTKRTLFNKNSFVGGMFTSRTGMNGTYNIAYGLDGQFRYIGDNYLILKLAQSFENDSANRMADLSPTRLLVQLQRRNQNGFGYDFSYTYSGKRFNPGIGFEMRDNYHGIRSTAHYGWLPGDNKPLRYQRIMLQVNNYWSTVTGQQETFFGALTWQFEGKKGYMGNISAGLFEEHLTDSLVLGEEQAYVPPGNYRYQNISLMYGTPNGGAVNGRFMFDAGTFFDGWKVSAMAMPTVNLGPSVSIAVTYNLDIVKFRDRNADFINNILGIKGLLTFTTKLSFAAFVQYNTAVKEVMTNLRFRFNPREGNDFYIVYNEGLNTNLTREDPVLPRSTGRALLLKYTYTFRF